MTSFLCCIDGRYHVLDEEDLIYHKPLRVSRGDWWPLIMLQIPDVRTPGYIPPSSYAAYSYDPVLEGFVTAFRVGIWDIEWVPPRKLGTNNVSFAV